jgi:hypothetical protein
MQNIEQSHVELVCGYRRVFGIYGIWKLLIRNPRTLLEYIDMIWHCKLVILVAPVLKTKAIGCVFCTECALIKGECGEYIQLTCTQFPNFVEFHEISTKRMYVYCLCF